MGLAYTNYEAATGPLREIYDKMRERPLPPVYRPQHGGVPGIIAMHSLDPLLIPRVFGTSSRSPRRIGCALACGASTLTTAASTTR